MCAYTSVLNVYTSKCSFCVPCTSAGIRCAQASVRGAQKQVWYTLCTSVVCTRVVCTSVVCTSVVCTSVVCTSVVCGVCTENAESDAVDFLESARVVEQHVEDLRAGEDWLVQRVTCVCARRCDCFSDSLSLSLSLCLSLPLCPSLPLSLFLSLSHIHVPVKVPGRFGRSLCPGPLRKTVRTRIDKGVDKEG